MLSSIFLKRRQAKVQIPAVWGFGTSYNGRFYNVAWRGQPQIVKIYQTIRLPYRTGYPGFGYSRYYQKHEIVVDITALPAHLAFAKPHLLAGKKKDDHVRILLLPKNGPPEIKYLHVTLNQILAKLEEAARAVESGIYSAWGLEDAAIPAEEDGGTIEEESSVPELEHAAISAEEDE